MQVLNNSKNAESILIDFENGRRQILLNFNSENILELINFNIAIDSTCSYQMGKNRRSKYKCSSCSSMNLLCHLDSVNNWDKTQELKIDSNSTLLSVTATSNCSTYIDLDVAAKARVATISKMEGLSDCGVCIENQTDIEQYLCAEDWINDVLINWITDTILRSKSIPASSRYVKVFVCTNTGYKVRAGKKLLPIDNLSSSVTLTEELIISLLLQLLAAFHVLSTANFTSGGMLWSSIKYIDEPCNYSYEGLRINSPVTIKLDSFEKSSINYKNVRVFPANSEICQDNILNLDSLIEKLNFGSIDVYAQKFEVMDFMYRISKVNAILFRCLVYSGYPLLGSSYDFYSLIFSLLSTEEIYNSIRYNVSVKRFWTSIFPGRINTPSLDLSDSVEMNTVVNSLCNRYLYCSVVERALTNAKFLVKNEVSSSSV